MSPAKITREPRRCLTCALLIPVEKNGKLVRYQAYKTRKFCGIICRDVFRYNLDPDETAEQKLVRLTDRSGGEKACWIFDKKHQDGPLRYGRFKCRGKAYRAHRLAYELAHGPIPDGFEVRHDCDNGACCNPFHLRVGTRQQNADDRRTRGRAGQPTGVNSKISKLSLSDVLQIRKLREQGNATTRQLMALYSVSECTINRAVFRYGTYSDT